MIRTPPQHNTKHPPGQIVNPVGVASVQHQDKPLTKAIDEYKQTEEYKKGFTDGWNKALNAKFPQHTSEASR